MSSVAIEIPETTPVAFKLDASRASAELRVVAATRLRLRYGWNDP
jgi:hypothetical protein